MKSFYAQYLEERTDIQILECDYGFITYSIAGEECYIRDLFILPEFRRSLKATSMANEVAAIALMRGCTYLTGSVCPQAKGADDSVKVLMAYGMKLHSAVNNLIIFKKEIL